MFLVIEHATVGPVRHVPFGHQKVGRESHGHSMLIKMFK